MQPGYESSVRARPQVPPRRLDVEGAALDEDVSGHSHLRGVGQDLGDHPVDVGVGIRMLGRHGVRAEPRRHAAGRSDRVQLR